MYFGVEFCFRFLRGFWMLFDGRVVNLGLVCFNCFRFLYYNVGFNIYIIMYIMNNYKKEKKEKINYIMSWIDKILMSICVLI